MAARDKLFRVCLDKLHSFAIIKQQLSKSVVPACTQIRGYISAQVKTEDVLYKADHNQMRESLKKVIDKEINPYVDQWEADGQFPAHELFKKLGDAGFLGVCKPTEYGGLGLDYSYSIAVAEELGSINCGGVPMAIGVQTDMATPALAMFGSDLVKKEFLAPSISGDKVACLGVSEVGAGSDVASIQTTAKKDGSDYIINGGKMWTTSGCQADWMCLLANTGDGPSHMNKSLICLPMDAKGTYESVALTPKKCAQDENVIIGPHSEHHSAISVSCNRPQMYVRGMGVHIAKRIDKLGMRSSDTAQVFFEDVRIPQSYVIGEEGMGFTYQMIQFQAERLWATAVALKALDNIIRETGEYTKSRKAFGQPILNNQTVHFTLAELQTEVELVRSLLYRATALYLEGHDVTKFASMCKFKIGRVGREVTDKCLQFWGGMGFTNEVLVSRFYRDFRLISIGAGADEVMLSIIAKYMNTLPKPGK